MRERDQLELAQVRAAEARARLTSSAAEVPPTVARVRELERELAGLELAITRTRAEARAVRARDREGVALHRVARAFPLLVPALVAVGLAWTGVEFTGRPVAAWLVTAVTCLELALTVYRFRPAPRTPPSRGPRTG